MLPEEQELIRLEAEQVDLEDRVATAELKLETTKTEVAQFQRRYYQTVGRLYAQLDELNAKIANQEAERSPPTMPQLKHKHRPPKSKPDSRTSEHRQHFATPWRSTP